jgi:hypothetical protein
MAPVSCLFFRTKNSQDQDKKEKCFNSRRETLQRNNQARTLG